MDELKKHFATDTEFEIALYILDTLNEQPQIFMVEDVLKQLYEKHGKEDEKRLLCDHVFFRMEDLEYITLFNGAVKLAYKGVSDVNYRTFLRKARETKSLKNFTEYFLYTPLALILIGAVLGLLCGGKGTLWIVAGVLMLVGAFVLFIGWLLQLAGKKKKKENAYVQNHSNKSGGV